MLVVVIVVVVVVIALAAVGIYFFVLSVRQVVQTTQATVTGATWEIDYAGGSGTFFGPSNQSACSSCPETGLVGSTFTVTRTFMNLATAQSHALTTVSVDAPFTLVTTSPPSFPVSVLPGASVTLTLTVTYPPFPGSYSLTVAVAAA